MSDRSSVNCKAFRDSLSSIFQGSDSRTLSFNHVEENMSTPVLGKFVQLYNVENSKSNRFRTGFRSATGLRPVKISSARW
jgi:hypothetical protein